MKIRGREISYRLPPYIVAEISCNHNGDIKQAKSLIDAAMQAGADAVKFQTYVPADLTKPENKELWALYERAMTPREWHAELFEHCAWAHIAAFSSPFSVDAVHFLETLKVPCYKIASPEALRGEIVNAVAATGKPVIISTGALSSLAQVENLNVKLAPAVFLHCVAQYPAKVEDGNLRAILTLRDIPDIELVGLSDHTPGHDLAVAATCLGVAMIEKHIKLDDNCIDAAWSLNPKEFEAMVKATKAVWEGLGDGKITATCKARSL